ncbi:MAG: YCF48-related protein [archaeon]
MFNNSLKLIPVFTLFCGGIWAQSPHFQFVGLSGERITAIAVHPDNDSILYVGSMSDYSAGIYGSLFKSTNAGATWDTLLYPVTVHDIAINYQDPETIYVGLGGANFTMPGILKTTDGGATWTRADSGVYVDWETDVQDVELHPTSPEILYAGTAGIFPGHLYRSNNGGNSWARVPYGPEIEEGPIEITINILNPQEVFIGENGTGEIYRTSDAGSTWVALNTPWGDGYGLPVTITLCPEQPNIIYAGVYQYGLMKTEDGGFSWIHQDSGIDSNATAIRTIVIDQSNSKHLYAGLNAYGVFETSDGGEQWNTINAGLANQWVRSLALTGQTLYAGTYDGLYGRVITTSVEEPNNLPQRFFLGSNYPNPFNSQTTIPYHVAQGAQVSLTIYNLQGQIIKHLVKKHHTSGKYEVHWDGTNDKGISVSSGLYFYRLSSPKFKTTRSLVYLK